MAKRSEALHLLREILWRPGVVTVLALYGLLQLISNLIAWTLPLKDQEKYQFVQLLNWRVWMIGTPILTIVLIGLIVRSAYRVIEKRKAEHEAETNRLERAHKSEKEQKDEEHQAARSTLIEEHQDKISSLVEKHMGRMREHQKRYNSLNSEFYKLKAEKSSLQSEVDKLKTPKLTFDIDVLRSQVTINGNIKEFNIILYLYICFHNSDTNTRMVRSINVWLIKKNEDETETEIPLKGQKLYTSIMRYDVPVEVGWDNRNLPIMAGELTHYHTIRGHIAVAGNYQEILDSNCFLRATMQAMNQKSCSLDFDVKWQNINRGWIEITPRM